MLIYCSFSIDAKENTVNIVHLIFFTCSKVNLSRKRGNQSIFTYKHFLLNHIYNIMFYSYGETTYKIRNYFLPKPRFNSTSRNWQNAKTTNDKFTNIQI